MTKIKNIVSVGDMVGDRTITKDDIVRIMPSLMESIISWGLYGELGPIKGSGSQVKIENVALRVNSVSLDADGSLSATIEPYGPKGDVLRSLLEIPESNTTYRFAPRFIVNSPEKSSGERNIRLLSIDVLPPLR